MAENITQPPGGPPAFQVPSSQLTPVNLSRMIPNIAQGVTENQRIGDSVQPVRATTMWNFYVGNADAFDVTLNIVIVTAKGAANQTAVANVPPGQFLKVGDGTNNDPSGFTPTQFLTLVNHYRVNEDQYTLKKWIKRRFAKGNGVTNTAAPIAAGAAPPSSNQGQVTIKYSWKPPKLKYNDAADLLPTNHYPVYLIWATANDGGALAGDLYFNCRTEMTYKDA